MKSMTLNQLKDKAMRRIHDLRHEVVQQWREMVAAEAPAGEMARAFAAGTLVSTIPVPMVDMAIAAFVMRRFSRLPRAPFFAAMAITNNLVMAPLYASTPRLGGLALGWMAGHTPVALPEALVVRVLVGYLLIAAGLGLGSFLLANTGFWGYQRVRQHR